ncbi:MAG: response regulator receiver protein [Thaumarchaeota archaeon]|nr:MAG: response regulator receiver protein [Nitrososphaerota archaeon]
MIIDEIKVILEKNGYDLDPDTNERIRTMLESIRDDNQINKLDYIIEWFNKKREESDMIVEEIGVKDLEKWNIDEKTGNLSHNSKGFFEIIGIKVSNTFDREVGKEGWTQPMIAKNPGGILGILMKKINGTPHYLLQAKAEPGNIGKLQLSPTLQATTSNLLKAHGGKRPLFAEYFDETNNPKIIYAKWQSEDGGRFHLKSNYNMIVEIDENKELDIPDYFIWITLYQIKQLIKIENFVGPHVRGIISYL